MVEACQAEVVAMTGGEHSLVREECERVGIYELAHLLDTVAVAYKFLRGMDVHSILACVLERST